VLDNAEHLGGLPALLDRLCGECAEVQLLVTSRVRCNLAQEWLFPLEGLAVPDEDSRDPEAAIAFDSIRLFERRATAASRGFELQRHLVAVIEIVELVAGLPLAIELAAGWVRLLPPSEIAQELRHSIDVLERDPAASGDPARPEHRSMRAVLERAWQWLAPRERDALADLSVFHGGFTRRAAMEVASVPLPLLSSLVNKSLLWGGAEGRFAMHPLVQAEAAGRAHDDEPRRAELMARHAAHYAQQLSALAEAHAGDHRPIVAALQAEMANHQRAWTHAVATQQVDVVLKLCPAWRRYFMATGRFEDGHRHFEAALALGDRAEVAHARAEARAVLAWLAVARHDVDGAQAMGRRALEEAELVGATHLVADCSLTLGVALAEQLRFDDARPWFERALQVAGGHGHRTEAARALNGLATLALRCGDHAGALAHYERALAAFRDLGDHTNAARIMMNTGTAHMGQLDWPAARRAFEQALRYALAHDVTSLLAPIEFSLGATLIEQDELDAAANCLARARERCRALRFDSYEIKTDYYLARIAARRGQHAEAARAYLAAARQAHAQGCAIDLQYIVLFVGELLHDMGHLPAARRVLRSLAETRAADSSVRRLVAACLLRLPAAHDLDGGAPQDLAFDAATSHLAYSDGFDDLLARLRPLPTAEPAS